MKTLGILLLSLGILSLIGQIRNGINLGDTSNLIAIGAAVAFMLGGIALIKRANKKGKEQE